MLDRQTRLMRVIESSSSLSFAAFAYVGVEVTAACALEARVPKNSSKIVPGRTVKFTAVWFPFIAMTAYVLAGFLVAIDIPWNLASLPTSQISGTSKRDVIGGQMVDSAESNCSTAGQTSSAFIIATEIIGNNRLNDAINIFLVFTALTCANTNLFVASRALFSLVRDIDGGKGKAWDLRVLAWLGTTNRFKVPSRALLFTCIFTWIPWLSFAKQDCEGNSIAETVSTEQVFFDSRS